MIRQEVPAPLLEALGVNQSKISELAGNANDNNLVTTGSKKFVVKRIQEHTPENEELEGVYRDYLADASLPVSRFIKFDSDSYVFTDGNDSYVVTDYIEGVEARGKNNKIIGETAAFLANLHLLTASNMPYRHNWLKPTYIPDACEASDKLEPAQKTEFIDLMQTYPEFWNGNLPKGIIHGDLHAGNLIIDSSDKIVSVIDWEEVSIEPVLLDLASTIRFFATSDGSLDSTTFYSFLDAYQSIRPLTDQEKELLEDAINYSVLVESVWAHTKHAEGFVNEERFASSKDTHKQRLLVPKRSE